MSTARDMEHVQMREFPQNIFMLDRLWRNIGFGYLGEEIRR
jgi:hypothetical protein